MLNGVMLQYFEWELPNNCELWRKVGRDALQLRHMGFTAVWLPPAYKGSAGINDVGYGVYDTYDLGEFDQKGTVRTKYGTRAEYLAAIRMLHLADLQVLPDIVLNHRMGADESEQVTVHCDNPDDRSQTDTPEIPAVVFTRFTFPGRAGKYSDFIWTHECFSGVDWNDATHRSGLYRIGGKTWKQDVDQERGNYDYLMGADVDTDNPTVREELSRWGHWYIDTTEPDGFRLDAVKHISASFYKAWLADMRAYAGRELFAVGEYWHQDVNVLLDYLGKVDFSMSLFDVPLHQHFHEISRGNGQFDMSRLFEGTLVGARPDLAVTFVDNHDTQPGQSLESWVDGWFKAAAYGLILLRAYGYPCVFYGDLYGIPSRRIGAVSELELLLKVRRFNAFGEERDYFDHPNIIGFTREGLRTYPGSGLAFLCSDGPGGQKRMYVGTFYTGTTFRCVLGGQRSVVIDGEGCGVFSVGGGGASLYVPRLRLGDFINRKLAELRARLRELLGRRG